MTHRILKKILDNSLRLDIGNNCNVYDLYIKYDETLELIKSLKDPEDIQLIAARILVKIYQEDFFERRSYKMDILRYIIQNFEIDKNKLNEILNSVNYIDQDTIIKIKSYCGF